jgi:hypothetical protein
MSILIKSEEGYYEIPADVLEKCKISKEQFEEGREKMPNDVATQASVPKSEGGCNLVDLSACSD